VGKAAEGKKSSTPRLKGTEMTSTEPKTETSYVSSASIDEQICRLAKLIDDVRVDQKRLTHFVHLMRGASVIQEKTEPAPDQPAESCLRRLEQLVTELLQELNELSKIIDEL